MAECKNRRWKIFTLFLAGLFVLTCYTFSACFTSIQNQILRKNDYRQSFSRHLTSQTNPTIHNLNPRANGNHYGSNRPCQPLDSAVTTYTILNKQDRHMLGSLLHLQLTTRNRTGSPRTCGGDFFQAKLFSPKLNASTAGKIVDHQNGTYSISFLLGWTGRAFLSVTLVHPREAIQGLKKVRETPNTGYLFNGTFYDHKEVLDEQKCYSSYEDGFDNEEDYCSYTKPKANVSFWCRRPKKKNVGCEQLAFVVSDLASKDKYDVANGKLLNEEEWLYFRKGQYFQVEIAAEDGMNEVIVVQKELVSCAKPLGLTSGSIRDAQLSASSAVPGYEAHRARLHGQRAWEPASKNTSQWLQIDLKVPKVITGIQTQGLWGGMVPAYHLMVSDDGQTWTKGSETFDGTEDGISITEEALAPPVVTRFLRIFAAASDLPRLRMELLGCDRFLDNYVPQTFLHQHGPPPGLLPCGPNLPASQSEGYFYRDVWYSTACRAASWLTRPDVETCLQNRTVLLQGDSTVRQLAGELETLLGARDHYRCQDYKEEVEGRYPDSLRLYVWTGPIAVCQKLDKKVVLQFRFHHFPVRAGSQVELANLRTIVYKLNTIHPGENAVVLLSLWAHFTDDPLEQFEARLWAIRAAIEKLHRRAPQTLVIFKSPNVRDQLYLSKVLMSSDWLAYDMWRRLKEIMAGLNVAFLDIWDMSACHHSVPQLHPAKEVTTNAIALLLSYICPM
ncbi:Neurexophilin [Branchiostoma belcheri]|nr:Neurexophilin [Branchiostoma belcheri]